MSHKEPSLTEKQRKHLRGLAHALKPVSWVGNAGVTEAFLAELDRTLAHHELIKLKVSMGDRQVRDEAIEEIVRQSRALLVARIGNIAVLYRRNPEAQKIQLPR